MNDLIGKIRVDSNYTRSINIERDSEQVASFRPLGRGCIAQRAATSSQIAKRSGSRRLQPPR